MEIYIVSLFILLALSAFFAGAEVALISISQAKIRTLVKAKKPGSLSLKRLKSNPHKMITSVLIGNNIVNVAAATITTLLVEHYFGSSYLGAGAGVLTLFLLLFGEIMPKTYAATHAGIYARYAAPIIEAISIIASPVIWILDGIVRTLNIASSGGSHQLTEADLQSTIELSREHRLINRQEASVIEKALKFHDITAFDVMTPADEIFSLPQTTSIKDAIEKTIHTEFSRIPLYDKSSETITGLVHIKDLVHAVEHGHGKRQASTIAQKAVFVHARTRIDTLMQTLQKKRVHIAFVKAANDKLAGLVTLEDVLEELVGEITDEHELEPETIIRIDRDTVIAHGQTHIDDINRFINVSLPDSLATLEKLIGSKLQEPKLHDEIKFDEVTMIIEGMRKGNVRRVRITKTA